ncbi:MAG: regulatory protein RecX [Deltaproteobacteria bacterium]|nr:regulatory protein RecX [Deltaproteobacteria bacterium]
MKNPRSTIRDPQSTTLSPLEYAYRLLAQRDYSEQVLSSKLLVKGFTEEAVIRTVMRLKEQKYLNDSRLAADQSERLNARGFGPAGIKAKLAHKGFSSHTIDHVLTANDAMEVHASARQLLASRFSADALQQPRMYARAFRLLLRRGYSQEVVESVMGNAPSDECATATENENED